MTDQVTEYDCHLSYSTNRAIAARNRQPQRYQHIPAQFSHRSQDFRVSKTSIRSVSPRRHMPFGGARPSCYVNNGHQNSVTQNFSSRPNDYDYTARSNETIRPSSWHANMTQNFCYGPEMPAFNATNNMPDQMGWANLIQRQDYPDLLFSPAHDHQLYSTPMMSINDRSTSRVMGDDGMPLASMQQTPSFAQFSGWESFNSKTLSTDPMSQDATYHSVSQYMPWHMWAQHQPTGYDDSSGSDIAYDSTLLSQVPHVQTQDFDVVQEELVGLGLYDDGPSKMPRSVTSLQSCRQARATSDRPTFLLGEGWEPPESEEEDEDEEYEDESSASEDLSYLDTPLEPAVYQSQQPQWPIHQNDQKLQPEFTHDQIAQFEGAHYWPREEMDMVMDTTGRGPTWQGYGWQYGNQCGVR